MADTKDGVVAPRNQRTRVGRRDLRLTRPQQDGDVIVAVDKPPTLTRIKHEWPPTVDVTAAAMAFGLSRSHAYELINRGEFPAKVIKVGSRYRVITESIIQALSADRE